MIPMALTRSVRSLFCALTSAQDAVTRLMFAVAVAAGAFLTLVLAWEVIARYVLNAPTAWGPDMASISFSLITFCAAPMLAWKSGHANMSVVVDALPSGLAVWLRRFTFLLAALICFVAGYFGFIEFQRLYTNNVMMITVLPVPKWWLMLSIVYTLINMGFYYIRHVFGAAVDAGSEMAGEGA